MLHRRPQLVLVTGSRVLMRLTAWGHLAQGGGRDRRSLSSDGRAL